MAHWFYKPKSDSEVWKPFGVDDSFLVEAAYSEGTGVTYSYALVFKIWKRNEKLDIKRIFFILFHFPQIIH